MKKKLVILINIIGIFVAFSAVERIIYENAVKEFHKHVSGRNPNKFQYLLKPEYGIHIEDYYTGNDNAFSGRKPDGLKYNSTPITVFGCSYAHGQYLNPNQTFSYKLAQKLKRPVYNRGIPAKGIAKMYYQSESAHFYKDVPKSDLVFYVMIDDHYRRMKLSFLDVTDSWMHITYKKVDDKLVRDKFDSPLHCFLNSTYIIKFIKNKWVYNYVNNEKYADKLTDEALLYFIGTRKNLEKYWDTKIKFVVIYYDHWLRYGDLLRKKLEANGFIVINTKDLTDEDLLTDKYFSKITKHPTEEAWDLLTPLIIEKIK